MEIKQIIIGAVVTVGVIGLSGAGIHNYNEKVKCRRNCDMSQNLINQVQEANGERLKAMREKLEIMEMFLDKQKEI